MQGSLVTEKKLRALWDHELAAASAKFIPFLKLESMTFNCTCIHVGTSNARWLQTLPQHCMALLNSFFDFILQISGIEHSNVMFHLGTGSGMIWSLKIISLKFNPLLA